MLHLYKTKLWRYLYHLPRQMCAILFDDYLFDRYFWRTVLCFVNGLLYCPVGKKGIYKNYQKSVNAYMAFLADSVYECN
jgi:hypothetical protein